MGWIPYCAIVPLLTLAGLLKSRSVPVPVLGKAMTSLMDSVLHRIAIKRSKPADSQFSQFCVACSNVAYRRRSRRGEVLHNARRAVNGQTMPFLAGQAETECEKRPNVLGEATHLQDLLEDIFLHDSVVDTHRATTNLYAVEHKVVVLSAHLRIHTVQSDTLRYKTDVQITHRLNVAAVHLLNVLPHRRRKGMVRAAPPDMGEELLVRVRASE